jgi:hypothetical protein
LSTGRTTLTKRSGASRGAGRGEGVGIAVGAAATGDGAAGVVRDGDFAQSRVWRSVAARGRARTAVGNRVIRFSYGRAKPEIPF